LIVLWPLAAGFSQRVGFRLREQRSVVILSKIMHAWWLNTGLVKVFGSAACMYINVDVIAFITRHKVNIVDTKARMIFLGGHPAKY